MCLKNEIGENMISLCDSNNHWAKIGNSVTKHSAHFWVPRSQNGKNANGLPLLECLHLAATLVNIIEPGLAEQGDSDIHKFHPQVTLGNIGQHGKVDVPSPVCEASGF